MAINFINQGKLDEAENIYRDLIDQGLYSHEVYGNLGTILGEKGDLENAVWFLKKAIELKPNHPDAYINLGNIMTGKGCFEEAIDSYQKALKIKPNHSIAFLNLGIAQQGQGNLNSAILSYKKALEINPNRPDTCNSLGLALKKVGKFDSAIAYFNQALRLNPRFCAAYINLGNLLKEQGKLLSAIDIYKAALRVNPDFPEAHNNIGMVLCESGDLQAAITCFDTALKINPNFSEAYYNLGNVYRDQDNLSLAINFYKKSLKLNKNQPEAYNNLGNVLKNHGDFSSAISAFENALSLRIYYPEAQVNLSQVLLLLGDYKKGLKKYEFRSETVIDPIKPHASPNCRRWKGESLKECTELLVVTEQGLGDTLQFVRYVLALRANGINVSVCSPSRLHPLIQSSCIDPSPLTPQQANTVQKGKWTPLLSVPRYLNICPSNPIITTPYLKSSNRLIAKWKSNFASLKKPIVGINWRGNRLDAGKKSRDIRYQEFRKILETSSCTFVSLQRGISDSESEDLLSLENISNHQRDIQCIADSDHPSDFLEYAAIIENCDLVITTGSTVAHISAAIGKQTWVLLPKIPDWRWGIDGSTSFWYPTTRLFRQNERGFWSDTITNVLQDLNNFTEEIL